MASVARAHLVTVPVADTGLSVSLLTTGSLFQTLAAKRQRRIRWSQVEKILERYYVAMASELQAMVVQMSQESRERPDVSSGRLDAATLNDRNRVISKGGFGIGVGSYLDKSQAKYWRQIEYGFAGHRGRHLYGVFGATFTGRYAKNASGRNAVYGPAYSFVSSGASGGGFVPKSALGVKNRARHFGGPRKVGGGFSEGGESRNTRMIIEKAIEAQDAYGRAFRLFRRRNRAFYLFRQVVMDELGLTSDQVGNSYQSIVNDIF